MAVWSQAALSTVRRSFGRIDAEFYRPKSLEAFSKVNAVNHEQLGRLVADGYRVVYENTKIVDASQITASSARFLQATNLGKDGLSIELDSIGYVDERDWLRYPKGRIKSGELLIEVKGQAEKVTVVPEGFPERTLVSGSLFKVTANLDRISPWYLFIYLSSRFGKLLRDRLKTNTLIGFVSKPQLYSIPVFIPESADEQDLSIQAKESIRLNALSREFYTKAQQLLEAELGLDKMTFQKQVGYTARASTVAGSRRADAEYFNPAAREIVRRITSLQHTTVRESFDIQGGFPWNSSKFLPNNSGEPVVRIRNIRPNYIVPDELTSIDTAYANSVGVSRAQRGDVVVGMDGIKYFYASILEGECFVNQRVCHLAPRSSKVMSSEYAVFMINSIVGQAQLMRDMTVATTVGHITNRDVAKLVIPTISQSFHDEITALIRKSIDFKEESKRLLEQAKARVEQLIEEAVRS